MQFKGSDVLSHRYHFSSLQNNMRERYIDWMWHCERPVLCQIQPIVKKNTTWIRLEKEIYLHQKHLLNKSIQTNK